MLKENKEKNNVKNDKYQPYWHGIFIIEPVKISKIG